MGRRSERLRAEQARARAEKGQWTRRSFMVLALGLILSVAFYGLNKYDRQKGGGFSPEPEAMILVDAAHPLPEDFTVDLQAVAGGRVDVKVAESLLRMMSDASKDGVPLSLYTTYRSVKEQREKYNQALLSLQREQGLSKQESEEALAGKIQPPGASEHHTGLAVDFVSAQCPEPDEAFVNTQAYKWLDEHAAEYGFILRYPHGKEKKTGMDFATWHFRYVGRYAAKEMKDSGLCLEEYLIEHPETQ